MLMAMRKCSTASAMLPCAAEMPATRRSRPIRDRVPGLATELDRFGIIPLLFPQQGQVDVGPGVVAAAQRQRPVDMRFRGRQVTLDSQEVAEFVFDLGLHVVEGKRLAVATDGFVEVALVLLPLAEIDVGHGEVRIDADRLAHLLFRKIGAVEHVQSGAQATMCPCIVLVARQSVAPERLAVPPIGSLPPCAHRQESQDDRGKLRPKCQRRGRDSTHAAAVQATAIHKPICGK